MSTAMMQFPRAGRELMRMAVPAAVIAMAMSAGLFLLGVLIGLFPLAFAPAPGAMTLAPVLLVSALGVLGGFGVFAWLRRRTPAPLRIFTPLALTVLLISFVLPVLVPGWTIAEVVLLNLMHVAVAAVTIFAVMMAAEAETDPM